MTHGYQTSFVFPENSASPKEKVAKGGRGCATRTSLNCALNKCEGDTVSVGLCQCVLLGLLFRMHRKVMDNSHKFIGTLSLHRFIAFIVTNPPRGNNPLFCTQQIILLLRFSMVSRHIMLCCQLLQSTPKLLQLKFRQIRNCNRVCVILPNSFLSDFGDVIAT